MNLAERLANIIRRRDSRATADEIADQVDRVIARRDWRLRRATSTPKESA